MANINKRGPYQYQAIVRRKGCPCQIKTFESRQDVETWVWTAAGFDDTLDRMPRNGK
ncbi:hypothetical protein [Hydrogenophaga aquatica]